LAAFEYVALDPNGHHKKGVMEGDAPRQIRQKLREIHLIPLEIKVVEKSQPKRRMTLLTRQSLTSLELALFTRQLATLLNAGMQVEEALITVAEQAEKTHVKKIIVAVHARVLEGHSLANALAAFPQTFLPLYCATIAAGEQTGHLDKVLMRLADYTEQQLAMKQKIQQGLIYPSVMLFIALLIVSFLMIYVVPRIVGIFSDMGQDLPVLTKMLLAISYFIQHYGIGLLIISVIGSWLIRKFLQRPGNRFRYQQWLLHLPFLKGMIKIINTAQFARTFGILTTAGVSVLEAMRIAADVVMNLPIRKKIQEAALRVREGVPIHRALQQTGYFTPMSIHLIASGETSGQLDTMLEKMALYQEQEVVRTIEVGLALFEPLLIVIMGGIVLFIVLAILLPIFSLNQIVT
jgi:general secretion pathway protein F